MGIDALAMVPFDAVIRAATTADAASIAAIYRPFVTEGAISFEIEAPDTEAIASRIEKTIAGHPWLVAEDDSGEVIGYAYGTTFRSREAYRFTAETAIYLAPTARGTGMADRLGRALHADLRERGFHTAVAVITLPNPPSVTYHERLGYRAAGTLPEVGRKFDRWHDIGLWTLDLSVDA